MHDALAGIPGITSRAMFGGWGIYKDKKIFGLIADGELYFKVDETTKPEYESYGSRPFTYTNRGKTYAMSYWLVPEEVLERPDEIYEWVEKAAHAGGKKSKGRSKD